MSCYVKRFLGALLGVLSLLAFFMTSSQITQAQEDVVRVDTNLVSVPVSVTDRDGRSIVGLKKEDFKVYEDRAEQRIVFFEPVDAPLTVLLLLDTSGSMRDYMPGLARSAAVFVAQLRPEDTVAIATFADDSKIHFVLEPTKRKEFKTLIHLKSATGDSFTTTFDAVENAMKYMDGFEGRKAIVLFSDGELYGRKSSEESNLKQAEEQQSVIYTIRFGKYPNSQPGLSRSVSREEAERYGNSLGLRAKELNKLIERVDTYMLGLARNTGGRGWQIDAISDLENTFRAIGTEMTRRYTVGYLPDTPGNDGERRRIYVKVNIPNAVVRSRNEVIYKKDHD